MRAGKWARAIACGLFFLCFALSRAAALELEDRELKGLRALALDWALTGQTGADMQEQERLRERPVSFVLWGQQDGALAENRELNRNAGCGLITLRGNSKLLLDSAAPLGDDDLDGCLLDTDTAMELFGVPEPVGSKVTINGRLMTVRGCFQAGRPLAAVWAGTGEGGLDRLTLRTPEGEHPRLAAQDFAARNGLSGTWSQPGDLAALARGISLLPAALLLLGALARSISAAFAQPVGRVRFWLYAALAGGLWFSLLWLTEFSFQLPEEMIPNRWSDFDFWGRLFAEKREELVQAMSAAKTVPELELILPLLRAAAFGLTAALLAPLLPRPSGARDLWLWCAAGAVMAFAASLLISPALAHDRALWLTLPAAFLGRALSHLPASRNHNIFSSSRSLEMR